MRTQAQELRAKMQEGTFRGKEEGSLAKTAKSRFDLLEQAYELKVRGLTYAQVAKAMGINERHAKRCHGRYLWYKRRIMQKLLEEKDNTMFVDMLEELRYIKKLTYMGEMKSSRGSSAHAGYSRLLMDLTSMQIKLMVSLGMWDQVKGSFGEMPEQSFEAYIRKIEEERGIVSVSEEQTVRRTVNVAGSRLEYELAEKENTRAIHDEAKLDIITNMTKNNLNDNKTAAENECQP